MMFASVTSYIHVSVINKIQMEKYFLLTPDAYKLKWLGITQEEKSTDSSLF